MGSMVFLLVIFSILIIGISFPLDSAFALTEDAKIKSSDAAERDAFGTSVSISGDTAIVGSVNDNDACLPTVDIFCDSGSAYIFTKSGSTWTQQAKLTASDAAEDDKFGRSVSISGDTAIVGADGVDDGVSSSGSVYIFTRSGTTWTQQAELTNPDPAASDFYGKTVSISGDTVIVGNIGDDDGVKSASGSAYIFTRSGSSWTQQAKLIPSDAAIGDRFGTSVSISGETVIVGARNDDDPEPNSGSAYVFTRSGATWTQQAKISNPEPVNSDQFGFSVSISGDTAIVAAHRDDDGGIDSGSVYVFTRSGSTWTQQDKLTASDAAAGDNFGTTISISDDTAVVAAPRDADFTGSAYVFTRSGTTWTQQDKLTASDAAAGDFFGSTISISGDTAVVGMNGDDDACLPTVDPFCNSGAAYIFELEPEPVDLIFTLSSSVETVLPDDTFTYTFTVTNPPDGEERSLDLQFSLTQFMAPGLIVDFEPMNDLNFECFGNTFLPTVSITCRSETIAPGETKTGTATIKVNVDAETGDVFQSTVCVEPTCPEDELTINSPLIPAAVDMQLAVFSASEAEVKPGDTFTYEIIVENHDPFEIIGDHNLEWADAQNAKLTVDIEGPGTIEGGLTDGGTCEVIGVDRKQVECTWDSIATLIEISELGISRTATISVKVNDDATQGEVFKSTPKITSDTLDPIKFNDTLESPAEGPIVVLDADLKVVTESSTEFVVPGGDFTYTVKVTNKPESVVDSGFVVLTAGIGGPGTISSVSPGECSLTAPIQVICEFDNIVIGETKTVTLEVVVDSAAVEFEELDISSAVDPDANPDVPDLSTLLGPIVTPDADGDGIFDDVDPLPTTPSNDFSDGTTFGTITSGNAVLEISDNPGNGVHISSTGMATVDACGNSSYLFSAGSTINISCASVTIEVVSGSVDVEFFGDDGTTATTTLTEGDNVTFEEDTLIFTNNGFTQVELIVNGQTIIVDAETSQDIGDEPEDKKKSCDALEKAETKGNGKHKGITKAKENNRCN